MGALSPKEERLVDLVSCVTRGDWAGLQALRRQAPPGEPDLEWREALLQSHLFLGVPRVVEALEQLAMAGGIHGEPSGESGEGTQKDPAESAAESPSEAWLPQGRQLFAAIYADLAPKVERRLKQHHPHFAAWILEHAYGRVLSRPGLDAGRRELLALVCLALSGLDRQLASHTRGAIRLGATREQVRAVLDRQRPHLGPEEWERIQEVAERFSRPDGQP